MARILFFARLLGPPTTCYSSPGVCLCLCGERVCILSTFFGVTFVFVLGTRSLVCALAQALCLTITTKAVTLRTRRVLSSTVAAGAVSSVTFLDSSASTHASESLLSQARSLFLFSCLLALALSLSQLFGFLFFVLSPVYMSRKQAKQPPFSPIPHCVRFYQSAHSCTFLCYSISPSSHHFGNLHFIVILMQRKQTAT